MEESPEFQGRPFTLSRPEVIARTVDRRVTRNESDRANRAQVSVMHESSDELGDQ